MLCLFIHSMRLVIKYFTHANNVVFFRKTFSNISISPFLVHSPHNRCTRCRVDFQKTPTKNCRINLSVLGEFSICYLNQIKYQNFLLCLIPNKFHDFSLPFVSVVPPTHLEILNDQGGVVSNSVIGPFKEFSSVNITCMSSGGKCLVIAPTDTFYIQLHHPLLFISFMAFMDKFT